MRVGEELLDLARADGRRSLFVVGTGKNVGKTVAMRAIAQAAAARGLRLGLTSIGRDGEASDVLDAARKPRIRLGPGAIVATARELLPAHPAVEIVDLSPWHNAAGRVVFARVRDASYYELAGPASARAVRECVQRFERMGCEQVIVDGALDRIAALAGSDAAVILAAGAASAATMEEALAQAGALAMRLGLRRADPARAALHLDGALTAAVAADLIARGEDRQIVVRDPTRVVLSGRALLGAAQRLTLRCERPLRVVAVTIASLGEGRAFEPHAFLEGAARATGLPAFDVYADAMAAA